MKRKTSRKIFSILLALIMVIGMLPVTMLSVYAGHTCPDCRDWIDGSPYCEECYRCDACVDLCIECGRCTDCSGSEICDGCSNEETGDNICLECVFERGTHCPSCEACYFDTRDWCEECGLCVDCIEIDSMCSAYHGLRLCFDCAASYGEHCPGCDQCYGDAEKFCGECGLCSDCIDYDERCSDYYGSALCKECAAGYGKHCPACDQCYFDVQFWCEECGQCADCFDICDYCTEETGGNICTECAIDAGMHCSACAECYGESGGDFCFECGICGNCADICVSEELCIDCAISNGTHCPDCQSCIDEAPICESCGECCLNCVNVFCENCNLCAECVLICNDCGACAECAEICPNCEEHCSECVGICDDCGLCLDCCEDIAGFNGCDCGEWVCVQSTDWEEHFNEEHNASDITGHFATPSAVLGYDSTYHWYKCAYCDDAGHYTGQSEHTLDAKGKCTVCYYVKDAKIQIAVQPRDSRSAYVHCSDEVYDESNIAHFSVVAYGNSALTYTWCRITYVQGVLTYEPLKNPGDLEDYEGPEIAVLVPEDACCNEYYICCFITDEEGNEVKTVDVLLGAKHNYQYYKLWKSHQRPCEFAERSQYGHILQCVGADCEKVTHLRAHEDEDRNGYCDICDYEIGKILITKQPKNSVTAYSYNPDEGYDDTSFACFSVTAEGESDLTYTWCRKQYVGGVLKYVPLTNPGQDEIYDGPELKLLVPEDACCQEYTYACVITDEEGNETRTVDVTLKAKHNYQYYEDYLTTRSNPYADARKKYHGHILVCVSPECGAKTRLRQHLDEDLDYVCEVCDSQKDMIYPPEIFVTAPKEGQLPSYTVTVDRPACYTAMGGSSNYTLYRFWFVSDNGVDNWQLMDKNTAFVAGKYYKFAVEMQTKSGYAFPTMVSYDDCEPYIWAKVNGNETKAHKTYNMDPDHYITIYYEFGICNDSVIENIVIDNVTEPIAGEKPAYSAAVRGNGYYIDANKNTYYDAYWVNEKWYYIKNGIGWFDLTDGDWVYENEAFIPGHRYQVNVYLKTEDGYTFCHSQDYDMLFTASVNGTAASGNTTTSQGLVEQNIRASFTCQGKKINTVMVNGLATPKAGQNPDYTITAAYPEWYQLDPNYGGTGGLVWYRSDGTQMLPEDTFQEGQMYKVEIKLIPAQLSGVNAAQFVSPVSAYVNGREVVAGGDWDNIYASTNAVYIYYTFPKAAQPPAGVSVSGTVTSDGYEGNPVTLQLIEEGMPEPAYEIVVTGNTATYKFSDVASGTYTLKVTKAYHQTYTETIAVNSSVTRDIALVQNGPEFSDISKSSWQYPFASYACQRNLMAGKGTDSQGRIRFDPNSPITREEFVQVLYNAEGKPAVSSPKVFPDVAANGWYKKAVLWAYEMGIASGMGNGNFGVGKNITRQDLAMMLYKYAAMKGYSLTAMPGKIDQFADGNKVADYAKNAMNWAVNFGVLSGKGESNKPLSTFRLDPTGTATRAECAAMLKNFMTTFEQ